MLVDQVHNLQDMSVPTLLKAVAEIGYALFEPRHRVQIKTKLFIDHRRYRAVLQARVCHGVHLPSAHIQPGANCPARALEAPQKLA